MKCTESLKYYKEQGRYRGENEEPGNILVFLQTSILSTKCDRFDRPLEQKTKRRKFADDAMYGLPSSENVQNVCLKYHRVNTDQFKGRHKIVHI